MLIRLMRLTLFLLSMGTLFLACSQRYFTESHLDKIIEYEDDLEDKDQFLGMLFDDSYISDDVYLGAKLIGEENNFAEYSLIYQNYLFLFLTSFDKESPDVILDYIAIEKTSDDSYLMNGPVQIDNDYFDWDVIVLINSSWSGEYTDDISRAFKSDLETMKIDEVEYNSIRIYNEAN